MPASKTVMCAKAREKSGTSLKYICTLESKFLLDKQKPQCNQKTNTFRDINNVPK
ncbi:hypothetical protein WSS15_01680 [Acetobacter pasteurianus]|nr:hypothetical protein WSS15_01680 [Acetobacter pasteurianus]